MNNNKHWFQKIRNKVAGLTAAPQNSKENNLQTFEKKIDNTIDNTAEIIEVIKTADETLYKNMNPHYEHKLAKPLMESPNETIRVVDDRGWAMRGNAEETNLFLIRVLSRILNESQGLIKEKALEALIKIFSAPDDNTTGWVCMLELSANEIAKADMPDAKDKLESLRSKVSGNNIEAIDYALNLLQKFHK